MEQHNSVATFFELGKNVKYVKGGFDIVRREEKIGCEVASHSWDHPDLFRLTDEKVKEQNDKTNKVYTLLLCNNLAGSYKDAGRLEKSIELFERVLTDRERILGPDHPDTLASRSNLAGAYLYYCL